MQMISKYRGHAVATRSRVDLREERLLIIEGKNDEETGMKNNIADHQQYSSIH